MVRLMNSPMTMARIEPYKKACRMMENMLYETAETVIDNTVIPEGVVEEEITVGEGTEYPLAGKITYPEGAKAGDDLKAVVLVAGDGANTMDVKAGNS